MVALAKSRRPRKSVPAWHARFLEMLPAIVQHARISFRHLRPEARAEAVQEVVCNTCCAVARLAELGKLDLAYPSVLARFGVAQVKDGRKTGSKLNCRDVLFVAFAISSGPNSGFWCFGRWALPLLGILTSHLPWPGSWRPGFN